MQNTMPFYLYNLRRFVKNRKYNRKWRVIEIVLIFCHKKDKSQSTLFLRGGINLEKWMEKDQTKSQEIRLRQKSLSVIGSIQKICDTILTPIK
jgi:hypothetical protein